MAELNHTGAFAGAQPLQGNVTDWLKGIEQVDLANNQQAIEIAKARKAQENYEQERADKAKADLEQKFNDAKVEGLDWKGFENASTNDIIMGVANIAMDENLKNYYKAEEAYAKGDLKSYQEYNQKIKNNNNLGVYMKELLTAYDKQATGFASGTNFISKENRKRLEMIEKGNYSVFLINGKPQIAFDENLDGDFSEKEKANIVPFETILQGGLFGEVNPYFDMGAKAQAVGKDIESIEKENYAGGVSKTIPNLTPFALTENEIYRELKQQELPDTPENRASIQKMYRDLLTPYIPQRTSNKAWKPEGYGGKEENKPNLAYVETTSGGTDIFSLNHFVKNEGNGRVPFDVKSIHIDKKGDVVVYIDEYLGDSTEKKEGIVRVPNNVVGNTSGSTKPTTSKINVTDTSKEKNRNTRPLRSSNSAEKAEMTRIFSEVFGAKSFDDGVNIIKSFKNTQSNSELPDLDELPDLE